MPAWHKATPGTHAFLGDDGGGVDTASVDTATVCDTVDRYRDWLEVQHPPGCQTFQENLPVVIELVIFDPAKDTEPLGNGNAAGLPIAKIHIPSRGFVGSIQLCLLHPLVPPGTILHLKKFENEAIELYPRARICDNEHGIQLGDHVTVQVIKHYPSNDDYWDGHVTVHVTVLDGDHRGQSGWMLAALEAAEADDGLPIDQFSDAVLWNQVQTGESLVHASSRFRQITATQWSQLQNYLERLS